MKQAVALLTIALLTACNSPVNARLDLAEHEAQWAADRPPSYDFTFSRNAMVYTPSCTPLSVQVSVTRDSVVSARCLSTDSLLTGFTVTIASLFATVHWALDNQRLGGVAYDPRYGFPTSVDVSGPPDAAWGESATGFHPVVTIAPPR